MNQGGRAAAVGSPHGGVDARGSEDLLHPSGEGGRGNTLVWLLQGHKEGTLVTTKVRNLENKIMKGCR